MGVGNVTNDTRIYKVPKITLCALHVTEKCRERILAAGGEIITFDQLALRAPDGKHTLLLQGPRSKRVAQRRFGAAGLPGSHVKPLVRSKGPHMVSQEAHTASQGLHMVSQSPHTVSPSPMVRVVIWVDIFEALIQCNLSMDNNLNTNLNRVTIKVNPSKVNTLDILSRANTNLTRITIQVNLSKVNTLVSLSRTNTNHIKVNTQGSLSRTNTNHSRTNTNHSRTNTNHSRTNTPSSLSKANTNRIRANMNRSIKNIMIVNIRVQINNIRTLSKSTLVSHSLVNILACNLNKINIDHLSRINTVKVSNPAWLQGNRKRSRDSKVI